MELNKTCLCLFLVFVMSGCQTTDSYVKRDGQTFEDGYKKGVSEQLDMLVSESEKLAKPFYSWHAPVVQSVRIPAHISNGLFIPEHEEFVIIKPGEWEAFYALKNEKEKGLKNEKENIFDNVVPFSVDITNVPNGR